jgi:hypothetical protein
MVSGNDVSSTEPRGGEGSSLDWVAGCKPRGSKISDPTKNRAEARFSISAPETSLRDEGLPLRDSSSLARKFILPAGLSPCLPIKINQRFPRETLINSRCE